MAEGSILATLLDSLDRLRVFIEEHPEGVPFMAFASSLCVLGVVILYLSIPLGIFFGLMVALFRLVALFGPVGVTVVFAAFTFVMRAACGKKA